MRRTLLFCIGCLSGIILAGCHFNHREAEALYLRAEAAFFQGDYITAQHLIDSISEVDSLAYPWIQRGITLNQHIILEHNIRNRAYIDSILPEMRKIARELKSEFSGTYDEATGDTLYRRRNDPHAGRNDISCLRMEFNSDGKAQVTSVYCGREPLQHVSLKVELPDGSYALSPTIPYGNEPNERTRLADGRYSEAVRYTGRGLRTIVETIATAGDRAIKISYAGQRPYSYYLSDDDRRTFEMSFNYLYIQHRIRQMEQNRALAEKTIQMLKRQLSDNDFYDKKNATMICK